MQNQSFSSHAILLYGPRKSGSSLLHNLLDGGSSILMLPGELKVKESLRYDMAKSDLPRRYVQCGREDFPRMHILEGHSLRARPDFSFEGLNREQSSELVDFEDYARNLSALLQDDASSSYRDIVRFDVESFAGALRGSQKYSHWAAKEVGGQPNRITTQFTNNFPESKIIYLVRDPRFVVRSILLDRKRKDIALKISQVWLECVKAQRITDFIFQQARKGEFVITYENMTANTEATMKRIAAYLEVEFEPILCEPTVLGVPAVVRTSSQQTTKVFQQVNDWEKNLTAAQVLCMKIFFPVWPNLQRRRGQEIFSYQESVARLP